MRTDHAQIHRRTRDRAPDPAAGAPAGARAALGAARGAASDQEARAADGAAGRRAADRDREDRGLPHLRQHRHAESRARSAPIRGATPPSSSWSRTSPISGRWSAPSVLNARYHVLGGTLSPLDGVGPQDLTIDALVSRAHDPAVKEIILALNATVDGQTTAHYITDLLHDANVAVDAARARRAGRRRARLSRRGHAVGGDPQPDAALTFPANSSSQDTVCRAATDFRTKSCSRTAPGEPHVPEPLALRS